MNSLFKLFPLFLLPHLFLSCTNHSTTNEDDNYTLHSNITSTIFWIGEDATDENNYISNYPSAWDENWTLHYGGVDTPDQRKGYFPAKFIPHENPFYIALPYNDIDKDGKRKNEANNLIPWASPLNDPLESLCKNRWIKITKGSLVAYAQWEDVGPFEVDDKKYIFEGAPVVNTYNNHAGIDLSPALKTYLNLEDIDTINWSFVDDQDVEDGPWREIITISNIGWNKNWYKPTKTTTWQWQLTGEININYDVDIYDIDLFDSSKELIDQLHNDGKKVICYFSAGSYEDWREDKILFDEDLLGDPLDEWDGERWLDISNPKLLPIMLQRLDLAKEKGCDGVEPDNIDGYSNETGFELTSMQQFNYNKRLADEAHKRGLSIGLKNDNEQVWELEPYFDFSISEECFQYNNCNSLVPFIKANKPVFNVEYNVDEDQKEQLCYTTNAIGIQTLILPKDLDDSFRYSCN